MKLHPWMTLFDGWSQGKMMVLATGHEWFMDLYDQFAAIVDALEEASVDYALCGGMAVGIHGYARFTKDIDLLVRAELLDDVKAAVAGIGFDIDSGVIPFDPGGPKQREIHRVSRADSDGIFTLDLLVLPEALQGVWTSRVIFEWQGRQVQVVSLEGLAEMKRWAGRRQDLLDLEKLGLPLTRESGDG